MKRMTLDDLKNSKSPDGTPNLVAVDGAVYDVSGSQLWAGGRHMNRHTAGMDLSEAIRQSPHGTARLDRLTRVGDLGESPAQPHPGAESSFDREPVEPPPPLIARMLSLHPHPISVHFPIALFLTAAVFEALGLITGFGSFHQAAFFNLTAGALVTPASIVFGFLSHRYNYGNDWNTIFMSKLFLSIVLLILSDAAVGLGIFMLSGSPSAAALWGYRATVFMLAPTVMALGYFGGRITFPR